MTEYPIADHDDAYDNRSYIPESGTYPDRWAARSSDYRERLSRAGRAELDLRYGDRPRNTMDLFLPEETPRGLAVFVHGGYWKTFDKSQWSWLAEGPRSRGLAVALPQYTLCPDISIAGIGREIAAAVTFAAGKIDGPVRLAGHSAGGQLVTRLVSGKPLLDAAVLNRVAGVVSISGVHDLRPMMRTAMNDILGISPAEAREESPVLLEPLADVPVTAWVGADERPEFVRQNRVLYEMWRGFRTPVILVEEADRHHFNVIDGLADPEHALCRALIGD